MNNFFVILGLLISINLGQSQTLKKGQTAPQGAVVYSLPNTSIRLTVTATREHYSPGPYAEFAKKYLGIDASAEGSDYYELSSINMEPFLEADPNINIALNYNFGESNIENFLKISSQGLIFLSDDQNGIENNWRFPTLKKKNINSSEATNTMTSTNATLYTTVKTEAGEYDRVAYQQNQLVIKNEENKAKETADMIFSLREKRLQIITGDTDATFSGNALGDAVAEINRLEQQYLDLFLGTRSTSVQSMQFDVVPTKGERHLYVAFRMSEKEGILMSNNVLGRPIVLELVPESIENTSISPSLAVNSKSKETILAEVQYRIPAICNVKIIDGQSTLLQSRIPVYQLGEIANFPILAK